LVEKAITGGIGGDSRLVERLINAKKKKEKKAMERGKGEKTGPRIGATISLSEWLRKTLGLLWLTEEGLQKVGYSESLMIKASPVGNITTKFVSEFLLGENF